MAHTKKTIAGNVNNGTANTFSYSGSFDVFKASEVEVELDNVKLTFTTSTINESADPREYTVDFTNKTVHIGGANLASTNAVVIQPVTDMGAPTPRATYSPGASVTSADLNNNQLQVMRKAMEYDEQKLSSRGGTMTGNLHMGENVDISFEGSTDNNFETTITVADPTSDKTITFPDTTGTVVTTGDTGTVATGMIAADAITGAKVADDAINSEHIADGSVDLAHLSSNSVDSSKIVDGSIVAADLASDAVTTVKITDLNVTTAKIAADAITGAKIADDAVDSEHLAADSIDAEHYAAGSVDTTALGADAVTGAKIADDAIDSEHYTDGSIDTVHIADFNVTTAKIAADAITNAKIADDSIDSEHYVDGSIDTAHIGGAQVTDAKLASNSVTTSKITDANVTTDKLAADSVTIAKIGCEQTTISNSDSHIPTSGAVVDYVAAQIAPIGGLEVIADEDNFPTSQPGAGVVISISDAAGMVVSGSGTSTTARTVGNGSDNVTINNFPSSLYGETLATGVGLMVSSTGSSQTYNYHKILAAETDVKQLSDDINDFNARYRVNAGEPGSSNDAGDLVYDTNANKMKVYDGTTSAWKEVTSTGEFKYLFLCPAGGSGAPTFNGSIATYDLREVSNSGAAASVTNAAQLIVSINGVVQKANTGTSAPSEGFALVDSNTIVFGANLQSGDSVFIIQIGSAVTIPTPGDGTVSTAKIINGAVTTDKIADQAVTLAKLPHGDGSSNGKFLRSNNGADPTFETVNTDLVADTTPELGGNLETNGNNIKIEGDDKIDLASYAEIKRKTAATDANGGYVQQNSIVIDGLSDDIWLSNSGQKITFGSSDSTAHEVARIQCAAVGASQHGFVNLNYVTANAGGSASSATKLATTATGVTITGTATATTFSGSGASLTNIPAANITGTLPAIDGSNLTGVAAGGANNISFNSGNGIDFSATADGTGVSNESELLDDYECGEWTGTINTGTANINNPWYVKIGKLVIGGASITAISDTSSNDSIIVSGLPFTNSGGFSGSGAVSASKNNKFSEMVRCYVSGTDVRFMTSSLSTGSNDYLRHSSMVQSTGSITFGFNYRTA